MTDEIENLLDTLHQAHCDNARQAHYSKSRRNTEHSTMPATSFIYEFFLYNSIYQYDWEKSFVSGVLTPWHRNNMEEGKSEAVQQNLLEKFVRKKCQENPTTIRRALAPLAELHDLEGDWTKVTPDARITLDQGQRFFEKLATLAYRVRSVPSGENLEPTKALFELIKDCRYFVYLVRNNIFHGSKSIGEIYEPSQRRRIEVYDIFLKCLVSLFFLAVERSPVAADHVQLPISIGLGQGRELRLEQSQVLDLVVRGAMKPEDSRLVAAFSRITPVVPAPREHSALFYPSTGDDVVTPVIMGLPYCSEFYFYDCYAHARTRSKRFIQLLLSTLGSHFESVLRDDEDLFSFEIAGRRRTIHCGKRNNLEFLKRDVDLCFYFHRGDSEGEGGSGQKWDSQHLGELASKVLPDSMFYTLTDGEPGGIHSALLPVLQKLPLPITKRGRIYYCGSLSGAEFRNLAIPHHEQPPNDDEILLR